MAKKISNLESTTGWKVGQERPIDDRSQFPTLQDLIDYTDSPGLFSIYEGLTTFAEDTKRNYKWVESFYGIVPVLNAGVDPLPGIKYPPNYIKHGVDYSDRRFNWVIDDKSVVIDYVADGTEVIHILAKDLPVEAVRNSSANVMITYPGSTEVDIPGRISWTQDEFMSIYIYPAYPLNTLLKIKIS